MRGLGLGLGPLKRLPLHRTMDNPMNQQGDPSLEVAKFEKQELCTRDSLLRARGFSLIVVEEAESIFIVYPLYATAAILKYCELMSHAKLLHLCVCCTMVVHGSMVVFFARRSFILEFNSCPLCYGSARDSVVDSGPVGDAFCNAICTGME